MSEQQTIQTTGLSENAASGLSYITPIPAIVFLVTAPYNQSSTVRFHAWQSIFFCIADVVVWGILTVLGMVPLLNLIDLILMPIVALGFLVLWVLLLVNAFNGKKWKLPVLGELAEKQAGGTTLQTR